MLLIINVIAIFSLGIAVQYSSAGGKWSPLATHQIAMFCMSLPVVILLLYLELERYSYLVYTLTIILLLIVNYCGIHIMGATRWIRIGHISLQPSEFAKIGLILALARYFSKKSVYKIIELRRLLEVIIMIIIPVLLVLKQPNLGTAVIMLCIGTAIIFSALIKTSHLLICGSLSILMIPATWPFLHNYHKKRIISFLNPSKDPLGIGYNAKQSQIAIGSGDLFGKGFVNGSQTQLGFLPEKHTDFAFAVLSEELGFLGSMTLISLYSLLLIISYIIAHRVRNYFFKHVSIGVFAFFSSHFFINIGMTIGFLPVIGDPLPFLSYGGSITLTSLICIGLLLASIRSNRHYI